MNDFRRFVAALATAIRPHARPGQSVTLDDVAGTILPYRTHRDTLELASSEDYDALLLRLAAGEGGYATTEPPDVAAVFQAQSGSPNPDLDLVRSLGGTRIVLTAAAWRLVNAKARDEYAPPAPTSPQPEPDPEPMRAPVPSAAEAAASADSAPPFLIAPDELEPQAEPAEPACEFCGGTLPEGRVVHYCPHCGENQSQPHCPACGQDIEPGWQHCIACGQRLV
jgi:hypothetical protein